VLLTLVRDTKTTQFNLGTLDVSGRRFHTMERPWIPDPNGGKGGKKYESCVPVGVYRLRPRESPKYGKHFILSNPMLDVYETPLDVPRGRENSTRTLVLVHVGNYWWDVIGCIAVGKGRARDGAAGWMVTHSREGMNELRMLTQSVIDMQLDVREV
jgi:hypothetical protein